jgi:hypothetical protein
MNKTGLRDDTYLAAIKLEWWPRSNWNRWPPSSESARSLDLPRRNWLDTLLCHEWAPVPVWRESAQNQCREPLILPGPATCHRLWPPLLPGTSAKSMTQGTRACRQLSRTALAARQGCAAK